MNRSTLILTITGLLTTLLILNTNTLVSSDQTKQTNPIELGTVQWQRNLEKAIPLSQKTNKPIFILFQEVPGCFTCQNYGAEVLSHPQIVEAIETLFIPVAIFNNKGGEDAKTLKKFGEPSWNNPVVRIISPDEKDLVPRLNGNYTRAGVVKRMIEALNKTSSPIPEYLRLLNQELHSRAHQNEKSVFAMYCFWSGEGAFGKLDGVISTTAGFLNGYEVVEVEYDENILPYKELVNYAIKNQMASAIFTRTNAQQKIAKSILGDKAQISNKEIRPDREPKYYTLNTIVKYLPMTDIQAARVNSAIGKRANFEQYLSPKQIALLKTIKANPKSNWKIAINTKDLTMAWNDAIESLKRI